MYTLAECFSPQIVPAMCVILCVQFWFARFVRLIHYHWSDIVTLLNENIFRVTGHLCGDFTGHRGALMFSLICVWITGWVNNPGPLSHYSDVIMDAMASQITSLTNVYSTVYSGADQQKTSRLRVSGLWVGNSPVAGEFSAQMASYPENVSIW